MTDIFAEMHDSMMECFDQGGTLRGQPVQASIEHGVAVIGEYSDVVAQRSIVTLPTSAAPRAGDTVTVAGVAYVLDAKDTSNGYVDRWFVR